MIPKRPYLIRYWNNYGMYGNWRYILVYEYSAKEALKIAKHIVAKKEKRGEDITCPVSFSVETIL